MRIQRLYLNISRCDSLAALISHRFYNFEQIFRKITVSFNFEPNFPDVLAK